MIGFKKAGARGGKRVGDDDGEEGKRPIQRDVGVKS